MKTREAATGAGWISRTMTTPSGSCASETAFGGTPSFASSQMAGKSAARSPRRNGPRINRSNPEYESASMP